MLVRCVYHVDKWTVENSYRWDFVALAPRFFFVRRWQKILYTTYIISYTYLMSVTYQPKKRKRKKTHGFLVRKRTTTGKNVIRKRRRKGRARLAV